MSTRHTPEMLHKLAVTDPVVAFHLTAWRNGEFRSWEEMLLSLCVQLAVDKGRLLQMATKAIERSTNPITISPVQGEKES